MRGRDSHNFYVIGGTTGHIFFLDVDKLSFVNGKWTWSNEAHTVRFLARGYHLVPVNI